MFDVASNISTSADRSLGHVSAVFNACWQWVGDGDFELATRFLPLAVVEAAKMAPTRELLRLEIDQVLKGSDVPAGAIATVLDALSDVASWLHVEEARLRGKVGYQGYQKRGERQRDTKRRKEERRARKEGKGKKTRLRF